ncbi:MAG: recombination protein NinG, partial [Pseudomonadota bacterium]
YRKRLIEKIGIKRVEWLEGYCPPKKWTIDELKDICAKYDNLCKKRLLEISQINDAKGDW